MKYEERQIKSRGIWGVIWKTNTVEVSKNVYMYEGYQIVLETEPQLDISFTK